jgi:predicted TIM-barrel fold metal-dependent hydrolase
VVQIAEFNRDTARNHLRNHPMSFLPEPEPEPLFSPVISADDHVLEPFDVFVSRVPSRHKDDAPHVILDEDGVPYWLVGNDVRQEVNVLNGAVGRPISEWDMAPQRYDEFRIGVVDARERVKDMDLDGVWASVTFPSVIFGFAGTALSKLTDETVGQACVRAYNDWLAEEWLSAFPDRFIPSQIVWLRDPDIAAAEIMRNAERGFRAVSFSENPECLGFPGIFGGYWDPFFAACEETRTVINLHVGSSGNIQRPSFDSPLDVSTALFPVNAMLAAVDWIYSRIPLKFPRLQIALSEGGASWVPTILERLHRSYRQIDASIAWNHADPAPFDVLLNSFFFTSIEDPSAFRQLDIIGSDRVLVETDYPHQDSTWPITQSMLRKELHHLDEPTIRRVCYENAATLYGHGTPPAQWVRERQKVPVRTHSHKHRENSHDR